MNKIDQSGSIYIAKSNIPNAGRGVFTSKTIENGARIETCPIIEIVREEIPFMRKTEIRDYYFVWKRDPFNNAALSMAVVLGYGFLYNHSYEPNALYVKNFREKVIDIIALRTINTNEEITINYNGDPQSKKTPAIRWIEPYADPKS